MNAKWNIKYIVITAVILSTANLAFGFKKLISDTNLPSRVTIEGRLSYLDDSAIVSIGLLDELQDVNISQRPRKYLATAYDHKFKFFLDSITSPRYVNFVFPTLEGVQVRGYIIEPNDSITINDAGDELIFSGRGSEKYNFQYMLSKIQGESAITFPRSDIPGTDVSRISDYFAYRDSTTEKGLALLTMYQPKVSKAIYPLLKALVVLQGENSKIFPINNFSRNDSAAFAYGAYLKDYKNPIWHKEWTSEINEIKSIQILPSFISCLLNRYWFDSCVVKGQVFKMSDCYTYLRIHYHGQTKERLLYNLIASNKDNGQEISGCLDQALANDITNDVYRTRLSAFRSSRTPGALAFPFMLQDTAGNYHRLAEFSNKVILMDFWYTGCGNCEAIHPYLDSIQRLFEGESLVVVSVSIDKDKRTWTKSVVGGKNGRRYTSAKSVNLFTNGKGDQDPLIKHYFITGYPTLILIDKNGKLVDQPNDPRADNGKSLVKLIRASLSEKIASASTLATGNN